MKNLSLILNGVLVIAVAVLFYLHFSAPKAGGDTTNYTADTTLVSAKGKAIVYLDSDSLLKGYEYSKSMQADGENTMYTLQNKFQTDAAALNEQLLFKIEDFLKGYAKANGHMYVIQTSRGIGPVLYGDAQLNVTADVINKLNEQYKKDLDAAGTK
jgi:hypothetical protein